jgi:hypothetical protein
MLKRKLTLFLMLMLVVGCATKAPQKVLLAWPSLPTMPRIAYVDSHRGSIDFYKPSFWDTILGPGEKRKSDISKPFSVTAYADRIYVSDTGFAYVAVIDTKAKTVSYLGASGRAVFETASAAAADGTIYVVDGR